MPTTETPAAALVAAMWRHVGYPQHQHVITPNAPAVMELVLPHDTHDNLWKALYCADYAIEPYERDTEDDLWEWLARACWHANEVGVDDLAVQLVAGGLPFEDAVKAADACGCPSILLSGFLFPN
jgi:hypothetical protein